MRRLLLPMLLVCALVFLAGASLSSGTETTRDAELRRKTQAIDDLFLEGGEAAARAIVPYLADRDLGVRSHAMKRLVDLGGDAVDGLIAVLADENVRWLASGALINIGKESVRKAVPALRHRNPAVRRNALFILRQLDARSAASSVEEALSDPDPSVQVQAIQTVAKFGGKGGMRLLLSKTESAEPIVREAAVASLPSFGEAAVSALTSLLSRGRPDDVRVAAIRGLSRLGTKKAASKLRSLVSDPSATVRYYACQTLGEMSDPSVLETIASRLDDEDPEVREIASDSFARMPDAAGPTLFRLLRQGNPLQKISAATAVRKAKYRPAIPWLVEALRDESGDVKVAAVAALMVLADPGTVEVLVNGLADAEIRWICVMALRQFGDSNLRPLLRRTNDPELDYWKQYVLEGMGDKVLKGCLEALEKDDDVATRITSMCTLRRIKDTRAVYPLIRLLADEKLGYVAGFVISQMGEVAVEPLLLTVRDENPVVRARAASALGEIGLEVVMRPLRDLTTDENPEVRLAAERAIRKIVQEPKGPDAEISPR